MKSIISGQKEVVVLNLSPVLEAPEMEAVSILDMIIIIFLFIGMILYSDINQLHSHSVIGY